MLIEPATVRDDITGQSINDTLENLHTTFSVALFKRWKFPLNFIEVVKYQHTQGQLEKCTYGTKVISYASLIASNMDMYLHEVEKNTEVLETLGKLLGITLGQADTIRQKPIDYVDETNSLN